MEEDIVPVYETGQIIDCPKTLEGDNALAAMVLEGWSAYIQDHWDEEDVVSVLQMARTNAKPETIGVREITGNRYEFYVRVKGCTPAAFYTLLRCSEKIRRKDPCLVLEDEDLVKLVGIIVAFATNRAREILHLGYDMQNFALIVSIGKVDPQNVHIDLCEKKQFQFGMLCSPRGELTTEYKCGDSTFSFEEGENLTKLWTDLPSGMQRKLDTIPEVQQLLDGFGSLLSPSIMTTVTDAENPTMVPFGTMIGLRGRVMHGGPKVSEDNLVRVVLFFTATPVEDTAIAYNTDTQYCRSTIIHDILYHTWPSLSPSEKDFFLRKWIKVGLCEDSVGAINGNMQHMHLKVMALELRRLALMKRKKEAERLEKLIAKLVNDELWSDAPGKQRWFDKTGKPYKLPKC
jgi:hypothetical protein